MYPKAHRTSPRRPALRARAVSRGASERNDLGLSFAFVAFGMLVIALFAALLNTGLLSRFAAAL